MLADKRVALLINIIAATTWSSVARAQTAAKECLATNVVGTSPSQFNPEWRINHPDSTYAHMVPRMARDEWLFLADSIARDFDGDPEALPGSARDIVRGQLDSVRREFDKVSRGGEFARMRALGTGVKTDRFTESNLGGAVLLFGRVGTPLRIDSVWTAPQRRAVCGRTIPVRRFLSAYGALAREEALRALQLSATRWDNLAEQGYFMYPWELAINSARFDPRSDDPPKVQYVVAHPAVGLEFISGRVKSLDNFQPLQTLTVELGILRYSDSRAYYSGITGFLAVPADEVAGAGLMVHLHPKLKVGYVWRSRSPATGSRNGFLVSTDLAQMIASAPDRIQRIRAALGQRIESMKEDAVRKVRGP